MTHKPNLLKVSALESAVNVATRLERELETQITADSNTIALKRQHITAEAERLGGGKEVLEAFEARHKEDAANILANSNESRWSRLKELSAMNEMASVAREHYSPIAMATSEAIGTEERSRFLAEYQGLGPAALRRAAERVKLTGSRVEAAALISVNDRSPRSDRGFSSQELAESLWSDDSKKANAMIDTLQRTFATSIVRNRQLEGKPLSATETIAHALRFPNGPRVTGKPVVVTLKRDKTALQKLQAGLSAGE